MIGVQSLKFNCPSGEFLLDIPEFRVAGGEKMTVIGASGSGKTTRLNLLAGIILPRQGSVSVNDVHVNDLSQGEKQRTAICRAMLPRPKLILADEATGNLDPENKTLILDLLFRTVAEHDTTLLAVAHDYELLDRFDRVPDFTEFRGR